MKSDLKYLIKNSGLTFALRIGGMGLGYVVAILISQFYGAEVYGRYSIMVTFMQFSVMIFSLGLPIAIIRLTAEKENFNTIPLYNYLAKSVKLLILSGLLGSLIIYFSSNLIGYHFFKDPKLTEIFKYLSFFFILLLLQDFSTKYFSGRKKFLEYGLSMFIFPNILFLILFFTFRWFNPADENYVYLSYLIALAVLGIILIFFIPLNKQTIKNYPYKKLLSLSIPILFSSAFLFISNWTDIFMLGAMVSKADVGIYSAAYKLSTLALLVILTINIVIAPKIAELYSTKNLKQLKITVHYANKLMSLLSLPIVLGLIIFRKFLLMQFGTDFLQGSSTLILLTIGFFFNSMTGTVAQILNMTDHQKTLRNLTFGMAVLNISLNFLLIPKYGITGAAIASLISQVFLNLFSVYMIKRIHGFWAFL